MTGRARATQICAARSVITMTGDHPEAIAFQGEWITGTGSLSELRARFPGAAIHDFGDACLVPGFHDAHQHPSIRAEQSLQVDLSPDTIPDTAALIAALRQRATRVPEGQWIVGFGYDPFRSNGGRPLTRDELDDACPRHPVLVVHMSLHSGVLNSLGLDRAGWREPTDAPSGGELDARDGRLTGVAHDQALYDLAFPAFTRAETIVPAPEISDLKDAFCRFLVHLHAAGITSVTDALVGPQSWRLMRSLEQEGRLTARVDALASYDHLDAFGDVPEGGTSAEARLGLGGVKTFADGAVSGGTCLLEHPAIGATGHGLARMTREELAHVVQTIHRAGRRACVHANGDRAIAWALEAIESAQRAAPRRDVRHRIEHASVMNPALLDRMRDLGVVAVPFANYVLAHGDKLRGFYGDERSEWMFPHRGLLDRDIPTAGSSDYPCGPYEPLFGIRSCVERRDRAGEEFGASQRITVDEALGLYTTGAAYASVEETYKGRLAPGYLADFVVLERDPRTVVVDELNHVAVRSTWVGGAPVWVAPDG